MQFERTQLRRGPALSPSERLVWDGFVRGTVDCWIVVARDEHQFADWSLSETLALEAAPLRICREILDDGLLLLEQADLEDGELFSEAG